MIDECDPILDLIISEIYRAFMRNGYTWSGQKITRESIEEHLLDRIGCVLGKRMGEGESFGRIMLLNNGTSVTIGIDVGTIFQLEE